MNRIIKVKWLNIKLQVLMACFILCLSYVNVAIANNSLEKIDFSSMPGEQLQIKLLFKKDAPKPSIFTIDNPARLVLDFNNISLNQGQSNIKVGVGNVNNIRAVESQGRVRVVVDLLAVTDYVTNIDGDNLILTLNGIDEKTAKDAQKVAIKEVDFRRGAQGEGLLILNFDGEIGNVNIQDEGEKIIVTMNDVSISDELERRLDVVDFATPVQIVDTFRFDNGVKMIIEALGEYDHLGYQVNNQFTLEVKSLTKEQKEEKLKARFGYSGERLSLIFQDIEVRAILQLIADFTGKNMVTSDTVGGNITLRLKNVPWDQALDIILKTKGLAMREEGNVIRVAPMEEISKIEKQELESKTQIAKLLPRVRELIQINYRLPSDIISILEGLILDNGNQDTTGTGQGETTSDEELQSSISSDVKFVPDDKTSKIIVYATRDEIEQIRLLIKQLDLPVKQVVIDARIVSANKTFTKNIGVKWGSYYNSSQRVTNSGLTRLGVGNLDSEGSLLTTTSEGDVSTSSVNLGDVGVGNIIGGLAINTLGIDFLLDLELQASESDGDIEIISSPRVSAMNGEQAEIEQGTSIKIQKINTEGTEEDTYVSATLRLTVTPVITPNNRIQMDVNISNDKPVSATSDDIDTERLNTKIVVNNGDTVVLGGIFKNTSSKNQTKVPFFGDLPVVGSLFKTDSKISEKNELLIFITPRILNTELSVKQ